MKSNKGPDLDTNDLKGAKMAKYMVILTLFFGGISSLMADKVPVQASDIRLLSVSIVDVKHVHSVDGLQSKNWTVKVFARNVGTERLIGLNVGLSAWHGSKAALRKSERFLHKRGHSIFSKKKIKRLDSGKSKAVIFHVLTPDSVNKILFGAMADCGKSVRKLTAAQAAAGKIAGDKMEGPKENDNYKELSARN